MKDQINYNENSFNNCESKVGIQTFLDALPYISLILNKKGTIVCVNQKWENFCQKHKLSLKNKGIDLDYIEIFTEIGDGYAGFTKKVKNGIENVLAGEQEFSLEYSRCFSDEEYWFKMRIRPFQKGLLVIHENITENKMDKKELKEQESKLKKLTEEYEQDLTELRREKKKLDAIFKSSLDIFYIITQPTDDGKDAIIKDVSPGVRRIFNYGEEELLREKIIGEPISKFHPQEMKEEITEIHQKIDRGKSITRKSKLIDTKGRELYVFSNISPFNVTGEENKVISVSINVNNLEETKNALQKSEENLKATLNSIGDAVIATDDKGYITRMNPVAEKLTGYSIQEAKDKPLKEIFNIINVNTRKKVENPVREVLENGKKVDLANHTVLISKGEKEYQIADSAAPIRDNEGNIIGIVLVFRDVTEKYHMRKKLRESKERLQKMMSVIPDMVSMQDTDMNIIYSNWNGLANIPREKRELYTKCYRTYRDYDDICPDCYAKKVLETKKSLEKEVKLFDGSWHQIQVLPILDENNQVEYFVEWVRDITNRKENEEKIQYISFHDSLTDLYNRTFMEEEIKQLDTKRELPISIIAADINGLKIVNEGYGHDQGDKMLQKTAEILSSCISEGDILARWADDDFVILLPQTGKKEVKKIAKRIEKKCQQIKLNDIPLSMAIGYATKTEAEQDIYEILYEAEDKVGKDKLIENRSNKNKLVQNMLNTLGAKSHETKEHAMRMTKFACQLGEKINLNHDQINNLSLVATLHDIGKVNIAEEILKKPESLTDKEWEAIKGHTEKGYSIAQAIEEFAPIAESILSHHERWDGDGYPQGLKGEKIPLLARIISIVDAYDVMTNGRPYKEPMSEKDAIVELKRCAGSQFDPCLVEEFIMIIA